MNATPLTLESPVTRPSIVSVRDEGERLNVLGDHQCVKITGAETEGRFAMVESVNEPGLTLPLHLHRNEDEIFYVLEGRVRFTIDGRDVLGEAGTTVFLPKGVPHTWTVVGETPARMLTMLMPAGLEDCFRELAALPTDGPPDMQQVVAITSRYGIEFVGG